MLWPKKNSYKEFHNKKKFLRLENSPPPHNFSNGPSLTCECRKAYDQNCVVAKKPFHALFPFKMIFCFLLILYVCLYVIM